jgi:hypothetical protein
MAKNLIDAKTYDEDKELFERLGLKKFHTNNQTKLFLGKYNLKDCKNAYIKVYVTCMPAQIWTFRIFTENKENIEINTGSGKLIDFWKTAVMVANGMIQVNKIDFIPGSLN